MTVRIAEPRNITTLSSTRIAETAPDGVRHVFVPSITPLSTGELLMTCRWDDEGSHEGDDTNGQTVFVSDDGGLTWRRTAITVGSTGHSSFDRASAVTHSLVYEDRRGRVWLYFAVNQPHTWGPDPRRSTGGGEIRRLLLQRKQGTWTAVSASHVVWAFRQPIAGPDGDPLHDIRVALEDKPVIGADGSLLIAVSGRTTVAEPGGGFWPLNRCWVLRSDDDGATFGESIFVGGSDRLALAEPTMEHLGAGQFVMYLRAQYATGRYLYRAHSDDGGATWSTPSVTGLPNAGGFGAKPFLRKLAADTFGLLTCCTHDEGRREIVSLYTTTTEGLREGRWDSVRTLLAEGDAALTGSYGVGGYGWLAAMGEDRCGVVVAMRDTNTAADHITFIALDPRDRTLAIEPFQPPGALPVAITLQGQERGLRLSNTRASARLTELWDPRRPPEECAVTLRVAQRARDRELRLLDLRSGTASAPWLTVRLTPSGSLEIIELRGVQEVGVEPGAAWFTVTVRLTSARQGTVVIDSPLGRVERDFLGRASEAPDSLLIGGSEGESEACRLDVRDVLVRSGGEEHGR